jgi:hypothetical protein
MEAAASGEDQLWITHAGVIRAAQWLAKQPFALIAGLALQPARLEQLWTLRAADWPQSEVPSNQLVAWEWPQAWPLQPPARG